MFIYLLLYHQLTEIFGVTNMIIIAHVATIVRCLIYTILTPDSFLTNVSALSLQTLHGNMILRFIYRFYIYILFVYRHWFRYLLGYSCK